MKINRIGLPSSSAQFKKPRNAHRPFELYNLLKKNEDHSFFTEEDAYYIRRYKMKKDGGKELLYELKKETSTPVDYRDSLIEQLNTQTPKL